MSLLKYRKAANLTQQELAQASGVTQQVISLIERSPAPNVELKTARALIAALNQKVTCSIDEVFPMPYSEHIEPNPEAA